MNWEKRGGTSLEPLSGSKLAQAETNWARVNLRSQNWNALQLVIGLDSIWVNVSDD